MWYLWPPHRWWFFMGDVPEWLLLVLTATVFGLACRGLRRRRGELALLSVLVVLQTAVLLTWVFRITPAVVFHGRPGDIVLDSHLVGALWMGLVLAVLGVFITFVVILIVRLGVPRERQTRPPGRWARVTFILLELFVLVAIISNPYTMRGGGGSLADGISPDGKIQVRLIPILALIDEEGLMVWRRPGDFWWVTLGRVGDELTFADKVTLEWAADSGSVTIVVSSPSNDDASTEFVLPPVANAPQVKE